LGCEIDRKLRVRGTQQDMKIGLIGMSGVGKTFWSTKLASAGFTCYYCDDMIASRLQNVVNLPMKSCDMGKWMGLPYEKGFAEREKQYLMLESEILLELAASTVKLPCGQNVVIDTTGSAIYADRHILDELKKSVLLVYLTITPEVHIQMLEEYIRNPLALIWNNLFFKSPNETNEMALKNSFIKLIAYREKLYEEFSDIKIEYDIHRQRDFSVQQFIDLIKTLPNKAFSETIPSPACVERRDAHGYAHFSRHESQCLPLFG
jgi:shikimate kinase